MPESFTASPGHQCKGKRVYKSSTMAKRFAKQAQSRFGGSKMVVYHCPHCHGWHMGHPRKKTDV